MSHLENLQKLSKKLKRLKSDQLLRDKPGKQTFIGDKQVQVGKTPIKITKTPMDRALKHIGFEKLHNSNRPEKYAHSSCAICLESYLSGELIKVLVCGHSFHKTCVNNWLYLKFDTDDLLLCPMCNQNTEEVEEVEEIDLEKIDLSQ